MYFVMKPRGYGKCYKEYKEIDKLERHLDLVSDQYLKLREDLHQMEKTYTTLKEEIWSKKYEG